MKYSLSSALPANIITDCLVVTVLDRSTLTVSGKQLDAASNKVLSKILRSGDLGEAPASTLLLHDIKGIKAKRVLLVNGGKADKLDGKSYRKLLQGAMKSLAGLGISSAHFLLTDTVVRDRDGNWVVSQTVQQIEDSLYRYDSTKSSKVTKPGLNQVGISLPADISRAAARNAIKLGRSVSAGVSVARELGNLPGNVCTPTYLAEECKKLATRYKSVKTDVLSEKQMARLGMGSLLSVSAGSAEEAKLIVVQYKGTSKANSKPYILVGKGITFDTGGISIKPGAAMDEMKFDMCGAASVVGTLHSVAQLQLPINVIGIIPSAENMPGGKATKPGDVVTSMSGKTIEILNTDAEGRLILCDALTYAERFKPRTVIDIATLTGSAVATFGNVVSALLANDQNLADELLECGQQALDPAWQLPLWDEYQPLLDSNFADIANIGGPRAGCITAACFLSRFTEKFKWAHLDIAGSAWDQGKEKGATGRPVSLLVDYLSRQKA
ncbi:MAG: leucyl aminopeptidase [Gammaproteobacteria bacterium]